MKYNKPTIEFLNYKELMFSDSYESGENIDLALSENPMGWVQDEQMID